MKRRTRWLLAFFPTGLAETVVRILMVFIQSFFVCTVRTFIVTTTALYKYKDIDEKQKVKYDVLTQYMVFDN